METPSEGAGPSFGVGRTGPCSWPCPGARQSNATVGRWRECPGTLTSPPPEILTEPFPADGHWGCGVSSPAPSWEVAEKGRRRLCSDLKGGCTHPLLGAAGHFMVRDAAREEAAASARPWWAARLAAEGPLSPEPHGSQPGSGNPADNVLTLMRDPQTTRSGLFRRDHRCAPRAERKAAPPDFHTRATLRKAVFGNLHYSRCPNPPLHVPHPSPSLPQPSRRSKGS